MQIVIAVIAIALCSCTLAQMTFTDHWSKRSEQRAPFQRYKPATGESEKQQQREQQQQHFCEAEKVSSALSQLSRLQEMQGSLTDYLSSCYQSRV